MYLSNRIGPHARKKHQSRLPCPFGAKVNAISIDLQSAIREFLALGIGWKNDGAAIRRKWEAIAHSDIPSHKGQLSVFQNL